MPLPELRPVRMARVALVAPRTHLRDALAEVADSGLVELDEVGEPGEVEARRALRDSGDAEAVPRLAGTTPDVAALQEEERWDLLAGEADLQERAAQSAVRGPAAIVVGWAPESALGDLTERLSAVGTSVVQLPRPRASSPPTLVRDTPLTKSLRPLVATYAVVPYQDVDPTLFAGITYAVMFGMMFGDVGSGLVLALLGVLLARTRHPTLSRFRRFWVFAVAAGVMAVVFGLLYGEFFGPTDVVPVLWLAPLDEPIRLLVAAVGLGAVLLGCAYLFGIMNRWREGGANLALYAATGIAGAMVFLGAALAVGGWAWSTPGLEYAGGAVAGLGIALMFIGYVVGEGPGAGAVAQAVVELFDTVVRLGANVVSFGRLAAFGLTHAAIGSVVWDASTGLWGPGLGSAGAVAVFVVGNALAFALEALVIGVQALRLEYYELFSRILTGEGRMFSPWHIPISREESQ